MTELRLPLILTTAFIGIAGLQQNTANSTNKNFPLHEAYELLENQDYSQITDGTPVYGRFNGCAGEYARKFTAINPKIPQTVVEPIVCKDKETHKIRISRVQVP